MEPEADMGTVALAPEVSAALQEGLGSDTGGEVVVRAAQSGGKIYLYEHSVAWVKCANIGNRFSDVLMHRASVPRDLLTGALEECQKSGSNFAETLLRWNLVDKDTLRECLRVHNATHLKGFAHLDGPVRAMFFPQARRYSGDFLFSLDELLEEPPTATAADAANVDTGELPLMPPAHPFSTPILTPPPMPAVVLPSHQGALAAVLASVPQAEVALLWDYPSARPLGAATRDGQGDMTALQAAGELVSSPLRFGMQRLASRDTAHVPPEVVMSAEAGTMVILPVTGLPGAQLVLVFPSSLNMGMALSQARRAAQRFATEPPAADGLH